MYTLSLLDLEQCLHRVEGIPLLGSQRLTGVTRRNLANFFQLKKFTNVNCIIKIVLNTFEM